MHVRLLHQVRQCHSCICYSAQLVSIKSETQTELGRSGCTAHIKIQNVAKAGVSNKHHCVPIHAPRNP